MADERPAVRRLGSREVYRSPWMRVREDDVEFAAGARGAYSVVEKPDFAVVIPWADGGFWLVEQFRYPAGRRAWEFPQGAWPTGASGSAEELAAAELREETGFAAERFVHLGRLYVAYGYSGQRFDVYLATGLTAGEPDREDSEADMVHAWHSEDDVRAMITGGAFPDSHSVAALGLLQLARADGRVED